MPSATRRVVAVACCGVVGLSAVAAGPALADRGPGRSSEVHAAKLKQKAFKKWAKGHGLRGPAARPLADPDRDGSVNWVEFTQGTDPTAAPGQAPPAAPNAVVKVKGHVSGVTETAGVISAVTVRTRLRGRLGPEVTVTVGPSSLLIVDWALVQNTSPANDGIGAGDEIKVYATRSGETYTALLALVENDDHPIPPLPTVPAVPVMPPGPGVVCRPGEPRPAAMDCEIPDGGPVGHRGGSGR